MFRAQQNAFDDAVAKATDENLTSENWEFILDVCDRANGEESGPREVVSAMIKRLAHRNANVQLYTLELANSLLQNCGVKVHREVSSRAFTDALLRLANDRNTHGQVKSKILERMGEWSEMFSKDPDLGTMEQAYRTLKSQNPNLHPPSKPTKREIADVDRRKEEEELQMALELSVKETQRNQATPQAGPSSAAQQPQARQPVQSQPASSGTTAATVSRVRALFDFQPSEPDELQFKKGDIIAVLESAYKDWWRGSLRGQVGIFPLNYVEKLSDPTQEELQKEAQMEAEVFAEIKNVEKLLTLLGTSNPDSNVRDNEEITKLYHSTLAIRPKLIELIGKYSQRKDDFTQLNEKFIKARRDYEALLEASMSQPQPGPYGRPGYPYGGYPPQAPPQGVPHDPNRFYPNQGAGSPQPPQPQHTPQGGPQPFVMANQGYGPQPNQHPPYPSNDEPHRPHSTNPPYQPPDQYGQAPQQYPNHPQELGTYSSPTETRPPQGYPQQFHNQPPGQQDAAPSGYHQDDQSNPQANQPPYPITPAGTGPSNPPQPQQPPPDAPGAYPPHPQGQAPGPPQTYQAYQPGRPQQFTPQGGNPNDFYR